MSTDIQRLQCRDSQALDPCEHLVQFYEHDAQLVGAVGSYLARALRAGGRAIVVATEEHCESFAADLRARGFDLGAGEERLARLDAAEALSLIMRDGRVDRRAFQEVIGERVRRAHQSGAPVHAYGEMVGLLWDDGNVLAAIQLERMWNELATQLPFSLYCGYRADSVSGAADAHALEKACQLHSSVVGQVPGRPLERADGLASVELSAKFAADPDAPGAARRLLTTALRTQGCDPALVHAGALALSELATNAVRHVGVPFAVEAVLAGGTLRVAVRDACPPKNDGFMPVLPLHGLAVIDQLASCWGVERVPEGKVVWAELHAADVRSAPAGRGSA